MRRQHGGPIINVFGNRRNLAVLWGLSVGLAVLRGRGLRLAVLRNRYLTVIGRRHSGLAVVRSRCGRLTIGRGWLVEVRSGCVRSGARSGLVEVRGCGSAVRCAVSTLRHRGSYCVIVETCAFRLAGHSHEHNVDNARCGRDYRADEQDAKATRCGCGIVAAVRGASPDSEDAEECSAAANNHEDCASKHGSIEDGKPPAGLVDVVETANG